MTSLGICIGASTIKTVELRWDDQRFTIGRTSIVNHGCNPRQAFEDEARAFDISSHDYVCLTGRKFKEGINLPSVTEPEATEYAFQHLRSNGGRRDGTQFDAIISVGSENFILYELSASGHITNVQTGNKCASGTGEFFLQQVRRMNVSVDKAVELARTSRPYYVSGRCSVFCKSDCTHALNKGIPIGEVSAGLGNMIVEKILELLQSTRRGNVLIVGGVTRNRYVIDSLKGKVENLVIPAEAEIFEALGAAIYAHAHRCRMNAEATLIAERNSFATLPALREAESLVTFKELERGRVRKGDECIVGLDVGSTTTKTVLLRTADNAILASAYLRTNGNPIKASRECYTQIQEQVGDEDFTVIGLGVTGSGRQIAGLHALTEGIVNEIIAHATAATYFDPDVDTILEIGGQDAKYTYLVNGVPCDYAMNEACSAGTGSFLEEAAKESLDIGYLDIQDVAFRGRNPPNFNDQCAAFISSDIKNASHENVPKDDIVAGLVYSIAMNYNNRVRGQRRIGNKIFMQGGVCYNRAVPLAMGALLQREIIVPPEAGLMGAFGVALEVKNRIEMGLMERSEFSIRALADRAVEYGKSFTCAGAKENCDRGCEINVIKLNGKSYSFGGVCNKYYNLVHHLSIDPKPFNLVAQRQDFVFDCYRSATENPAAGKTVGIPKTFHVATLFPLYYHFFTRLGLRVFLSERVDKEDAKRISSSFCFPVEISHGIFSSLLDEKPDYIFLPVVTELYVENSVHGVENATEKHTACIIAQGEPSYLRSVFREVEAEMISPVLNFSKGWEAAEGAFAGIAEELGFPSDQGRKAYQFALEKQKEFSRKRKEIGERVLAELEQDRSKMAVVLFGRAYNAFTEEANLGIPRKIASRGVVVIPYDCLSYDSEKCTENMTWATGQEIIKAANLVKRHPQLFGVYITSFSCGPDSFLVGYFRDIMKTKPSLTLELDSHSADAGINTRIEAFLDIVARYRKSGIVDEEPEEFQSARLILRGKKVYFVSSDNTEHLLSDPRLKILIPSMGRTLAEAGAAALRGMGYNSEAVPLPDSRTMMIGKRNTSCKECLPLILTTSSLLEYLEKRKKGEAGREGELLLYFMPTTTGGCRFSQYSVFLNKMLVKKRIKNVALFTLTSENNYAGFGILKQIKLLKAIIVADIMDDIKNAMLVLAVDAARAMEVFDVQWATILRCFERKTRDLSPVLHGVASTLARIELKYPLSKAKKVLLAGEIYIRRDEFSSQEVVSTLTRKGIITKRAPMLEWLYYIDYLLKNEYESRLSFSEKAEVFWRDVIQRRIERNMKSILAQSGLYEYEPIEVDEVVKIGSNFVSTSFTGEIILVLGSFFKDIVRHVHGVISIGPFACLPTRIIESILTKESVAAGNRRLESLENAEELMGFDKLPFLSIEADGNPFPQIINSKMEAFCLQVERLHATLASRR